MQKFVIFFLVFIAFNMQAALVTFDIAAEPSQPDIPTLTVIGDDGLTN